MTADAGRLLNREDVLGPQRFVLRQKLVNRRLALVEQSRECRLRANFSNGFSKCGIEACFYAHKR